MGRIENLLPLTSAVWHPKQPQVFVTSRFGFSVEAFHCLSKARYRIDGDTLQVGDIHFNSSGELFGTITKREGLECLSVYVAQTGVNLYNIKLPLFCPPISLLMMKGRKFIVWGRFTLTKLTAIDLQQNFQKELFESTERVSKVVASRD